MGEVKQSDLMLTKIARHGTRITDIGKRSGYNDSIEVGKHAGDLILMAFNERIHNGHPLFLLLRMRIGDSTYIGSGFAGLGWNDNSLFPDYDLAGYTRPKYYVVIKKLYAIPNLSVTTSLKSQPPRKRGWNVMDS